MTPEIISVLAAFAPVFTRPTWNNIHTLIDWRHSLSGSKAYHEYFTCYGLK